MSDENSEQPGEFWQLLLAEAEAPPSRASDAEFAKLIEGVELAHAMMDKLNLSEALARRDFGDAVINSAIVLFHALSPHDRHVIVAHPHPYRLLAQVHVNSKQ